MEQDQYLILCLNIIIMQTPGSYAIKGVPFVLLLLEWSQSPPYTTSSQVHAEFLHTAWISMIE